MLRQLIFSLALLTITSQIFAQKLTIDGNKFKREGKTIFFNGINTPWQNDSDFKIDFLGTPHFDSNYWITQFQNMKNNKVNSVRIWVHGRGNNTPEYDNNGFTLSPSQEFYDDLDFVLNLATQHKIYVILNMWSFDMVLKSGSGQPGSSQFIQHRNTILDNNKTESYLNNFLKPVVERYIDSPYLFAYEVMNEPEAVWENANNLVDGAINRNQMIAFVAKTAAKIHDVSNKKKFVTVGSKWIIYNSSNFNSYGGQISPGDNYTDASLRAQFNNSNAYLDFYSMHWYQWQSTGSPFNQSVSNLYPRVSKPVLVAEYPGIDLPNNDCGCTCSTPGICNFNKTVVQAYKDIENNGFAGVTAWRNGQEDDGFGTSNKIYEATRAFSNANPDLVIPQPNAHSNLKIKDYTANGFTLDWKANENATNGTKIFIEDQNNNSGEIFVATLNPGETSYQFSGSYGSVNIKFGGSYKLKLQALPDDNSDAFSQITASYGESFENTFGQWSQSPNDDLDWSLNSNRTPSNNTGPASASEGSSYIYVEASGDGQGFPNKKAILRSSTIDLTSATNTVFNFKYHMFGADDFGSINLEISDNDGSSWSSIWELSGNKGDSWKTSNLDLSSYSGKLIKLRFIRITGNTWQADFAFDDFQFKDEIIVTPPACSNAISTFPYTESFESNLGSWKQATTDDINWSINSNGTPSNNTGPSNSIDGSSYVYVEASGDGSGFPNKRAILESPCFDLKTSTVANFIFKYHMFGASAFGEIDLEISLNNDGNWVSIWNLSGNKGNSWLTANIDLKSYVGNTIKLRFNRITGTTWQADFALDALSLTDSEIVPPTECSGGITAFPYNQSYENTIGDWSQSTNDDINWALDGNGTPSSGTGPSSATDGSFYMYVEASGNGTGFPDKQAILNSPCYDLTNESTATFNFDYHMFGATDFGTIALQISNDNGNSWSTIWSLNGNQGNNWISESVDLSTYLGSSIQLRFNRITGGTWQADFALDNINLSTSLISRNAQKMTENSLLGNLNDIKIYPNPINNGVLNVSTFSSNLEYVIYNIFGQRISNGTLKNKSINVTNLEAAVYIIEFSNEEETITKRFIKK